MRLQCGRALLSIALFTTTAITLMLASGCSRPGEWEAQDPASRSIVPSPFPQNYAWTLMTFDGALAGEGSVAQPQRDIDDVRGRYTEAGIVIDFGHGDHRFYTELRPLEGTGRYIVDASRGYFKLSLPSGVWDSTGRGICSFNFWRVAGPEVPLSPPPGGEVFEVDIGFVCTSLASQTGQPLLNIVDGRVHAFLLRPPASKGAE